MPENTTIAVAGTEPASPKTYWEFWKSRRERAHLLTDPGEIGADMAQFGEPVKPEYVRGRV